MTIAVASAARPSRGQMPTMAVLEVSSTKGVERLAEGAGDVSRTVLAAARRGDHAAFAEIVRHYDPGLRRLAFHVLADRCETDDVLQDAYVKAFRALPAFEARSSLGTWLYRITYTTCIDRLRRLRRDELDERIDEIADGNVSGDLADALAAAQGVTEALRLLPPVHRAVALLVGAAGLSQTQAAAIIGVPAGTVASRMASIRRILSKALVREREAGEMVAAAKEET